MNTNARTLSTKTQYGGGHAASQALVSRHVAEATLAQLVGQSNAGRMFHASQEGVVYRLLDAFSERVFVARKGCLVLSIGAHKANEQEAEEFARQQFASA